MTEVDSRYLGDLVGCLQRCAFVLKDNGLYQDAIKALLILSEGDPSFDAGAYAYQLGGCFEALEKFDEAQKWYKIAAREGPFMPEYQTALENLQKYWSGKSDL